MMIMSRREGETILIGDEIEIVIAHIGRSRVKIGIRAPRELTVVQREVKLVREENLAAASPASFVAKWPEKKLSNSNEFLKFSKTPPKSNLG